MILLNLLLFLLFLFVLVKSANYAIRFSSRIARIMRFPEFLVSFFVVAFISVLPEGTISIISAIEGKSTFGMGTLLGSNVADLSLIFGIIALFSFKGVKIESKIIRDNMVYLVLLLFPLLLGLDGNFSRTDGLLLLACGALFFVKIYNESKKFSKKFKHNEKFSLTSSIVFLVISMAALLLSAFFIIHYASSFANDLGIPAVLIGLTLVALGTTLPELVFSLKAVRKRHDGLALGDMLGTVITDATILLGIVALISPFSFDPMLIYTAGGAMFLAGLLVFMFMKSGRVLSKIEGLILIFFYIAYLMIEFLINK